jgi:hypothetical protein
MEAYCGPDWDEDPVSMALTVVARLLWRNNIKHADVGMIQASWRPALDWPGDRCNLFRLDRTYL